MIVEDVAKAFAAEELNPELKKHMVDAGDMGTWIRHPLMMQPFYSPPLNRTVNATLRQKKETLDSAISSGDWNTAIFVHERPFRLQAFTEYCFRMRHEEYWSNLGRVWVDSESPGINLKMWLLLLRSKRPGRENLMDEVELSFLSALPNTLTIYRGSHFKHRKSLAWTTSHDMAEWFATRFSAGGEVFTGTVNKSDIFAYFTGRDENEILVDPRFIKGIARAK